MEQPDGLSPEGDITQALSPEGDFTQVLSPEGDFEAAESPSSELLVPVFLGTETGPDNGALDDPAQPIDYVPGGSE